MSSRPAVSDILPTAVGVRNVERWLTLSNGTHADWYNRAHDIGRYHPAGPGILAALSPQLRWDRNVEGLHHVADTGTAYRLALPLSNDRAIAIRNGADPDVTLCGPKVRAFYANISDPTLAGPVTVDRHALALAFPDHALSRIIERKGAYEHVADVYRMVADAHNLKPHEVQAVTWCAYRGTYD